MDYYDCSKCENEVPEIGGYEIVNDEVICQDCMFRLGYWETNHKGSD